MPPVRLGVLTLAGALAATSATGQSDIGDHAILKAQHFAAKGSRALRAGNFNAALPMFRKALEAVPQFPDAHMGLGHVALREHAYEEALAAYQNAERGYVTLGEAMFQRRLIQYDEAQDEIRNLREELTELRGRANRAGTNENEPGLTVMKLEQAIAQLELVKRPSPGEIEIAPAEVSFFIGNALMHLGRLDEAIQAWTTTIHRDASFAPAYNNLAVALWKAGRVSEARACVARAEALGVVTNPAFKSDLDRAGPSEPASCP
jgi:tetratricopeptide (TPR) repeat protein